MFPSSSFLESRKQVNCLDEMMWVEGPVIELNGELILLITLASDCSGLATSSALSECMKVVIPDKVAEILRIETGDMVCLRSADGRFRLHALKAGVFH
jgi:hypothetical protein